MTRLPMARRTAALPPPRMALPAILLLALGLRLAVVLWLSDTVPHSDYRYYHMAGEKIAADWLFFFDSSQAEYYGKFGWWPPVYPFLVGAVYGLFGVSHRAVVFGQVLLGTFVCWLVYRLGRRCAGERTGLVAALLLAVDPTYVFTTNLLASENLFVLWLVLGLLMATREPGGRRTQAAAGVAFALGALTRAIGLVVPAVVALWQRRRARSRRAWLVQAAWMLGACAASIAPWTLRNAIVVGSPALVCFGGGLNFYFGHNQESIGYRDLSKTPMAHLLTQAEIDRMGYRLGLAYVAAEPFGFLGRAGNKLAALFGSPAPAYAPHANSAIMLPEGWRTDPAQTRIAEALRSRQRAKNRLLDGVFSWLAAAHSYAMLTGALAAVLFWRRLTPELRLMVYLSLYWILAHVVFWAQPRFRYPMEIFLVVLTAWSLTRLPWRDAAGTAQQHGRQR